METLTVTVAVEPLASGLPQVITPPTLLAVTLDEQMILLVDKLSNRTPCVAAKPGFGVLPFDAHGPGSAVASHGRVSRRSIWSELPVLFAMVIVYVQKVSTAGLMVVIFAVFVKVRPSVAEMTVGSGVAVGTVVAVDAGVLVRVAVLPVPQLEFAEAELLLRLLSVPGKLTVALLSMVELTQPALEVTKIVIVADALGPSEPPVQVTVPWSLLNPVISPSGRQLNPLPGEAETDWKCCFPVPLGTSGPILSTTVMPEADTEPKFVTTIV